MNALKAFLDKRFGVTATGSSIGREARAGLTTFLTMSYILFVNPDLLQKAIPIDGAFAQLMAATAIAAAVGSIIMGIAANYPFALAPGMGLNAFFVYTLVLGQGLSWRTALAAVFVGGLLFLVLSITGARRIVVDAIPTSLKRATAAGIGLFLAMIGLENAGIVVDHPATLVTLGNLTSPGALLALLGLFLTVILLSRKISGAFLIGIAVTSAVAILSGASVFAGATFGGFTNGIVSLPTWPKDLFMQLDFAGLLDPRILPLLFTLVFVDFFDTAGTLMGLAEKAGYTDEKGGLPRANIAFTADAVATTVGAVIGSSPTTTYIESASGIEDGGRTGLTAVFVGLFFLLSLFFWPLASAIPSVATAPILILVGALMITPVAKIDWDNMREALPAFLTMILMPLTFSISNGVAAGIIATAVIAPLTGRPKSVHWILYALAVVLVAFFAFGSAH